MHITKEIKDKLTGKKCAYCGKKPKLIDAADIYRQQGYGQLWYCMPCGAWVGCHKGTSMPLGRLAKKPLREAKKLAHFYFDQIFIKRILNRHEAYKWLSQKLNIPSIFTHIGMFNEKTCADVVYFSKQLLNDMNRLDKDYGVDPPTMPDPPINYDALPEPFTQNQI